MECFPAWMGKTVLAAAMLSCSMTAANAAYNPYTITAQPSVPLTTQYPLANYLDVTWVGAKCDGTTNDTVAIQLAVTKAEALHLTLLVPNMGATCKITDNISITGPIAITGGFGGSITQATGGKGIFVGSGNNVTVTNLTLIGPQSTAYVDAEAAIDIEGVFHAGSAPTLISNLNLTNLNISGFGGYAIKTKYVTGFHYDGNTINNIGFTGIEALSATYGSIKGNVIDTVNSTGLPGNNAYGVIVSRDTGDSGNLTSQPNSAYVHVDGNTVRNIPTWDGLNTHSGQFITFADDIIYNVHVGFDIGGSRNSAGTYAYTPNSVTVTNPIVDTGVTDGSRSFCIIFSGDVGSPLATGSIVGGVLTGCGDQTTALGGAILVQSVYGLTISGTSIIQPAVTGVLVNGNNTAVMISGVIVADPWTNTVGVGQAIAFNMMGPNNDLTITGTSAYHYSSFSATYLLTSAAGTFFRADSSSGNFVHLGVNNTNATSTYILNSATLTIDGRYVPPTTCPSGSTGMMRNNSGAFAICP